jgi:hypothetical protein
MTRLTCSLERPEITITSLKITVWLDEYTNMLKLDGSWYCSELLTKKTLSFDEVSRGYVEETITSSSACGSTDKVSLPSSSNRHPQTHFRDNRVSLYSSCRDLQPLCS